MSVFVSESGRAGFLLASERARLYQVIKYGADKQFSAMRMIARIDAGWRFVSPQALVLMR